MAVRSASDIVYVLVSRLPLIALAVFLLWVFLQGLTHLELYSFGTEYMVSNANSTNRMPTLGGTSDAALLEEALASGDTSRMSAALDQLEQSGDGAAAADAAGSIR